MSHINETQKAVAEARDRLVGYLTAAGLSTPRAKANVTYLVRAVEARDVERALSELLTDDTGDETDAAYNRGVQDAARAITQNGA